MNLQAIVRAQQGHSHLCDKGPAYELKCALEDAYEILKANPLPIGASDLLELERQRVLVALHDVIGRAASLVDASRHV